MTTETQPWYRRVPRFKELGALGLMQRGMLFGGAVVLSLVMVGVAGLATYAKVSNYIAAGREIFSRTKRCC